MLARFIIYIQIIATDSLYSTLTRLSALRSINATRQSLEKHYSAVLCLSASIVIDSSGEMVELITRESHADVQARAPIRVHGGVKAWS